MEARGRWGRGREILALLRGSADRTDCTTSKGPRPHSRALLGPRHLGAAADAQPSPPCPTLVRAGGRLGGGGGGGGGAGRRGSRAREGSRPRALQQPVQNRVGRSADFAASTCTRPHFQIRPHFLTVCSYKRPTPPQTAAPTRPGRTSTAQGPPAFWRHRALPAAFSPLPRRSGAFSQ